VFVVDDHHFRNSYFIWPFSVTSFKLLMEHYTDGTVCIRVYYVYYTYWLINVNLLI